MWYVIRIMANHIARSGSICISSPAVSAKGVLRYSGASAAFVVAFLIATTGAALGQTESSRTAGASKAPSKEDAKEPSGFYFEAFPEFTEGTYGTQGRSETFYLPLTLGYDRNSIVASVTVPFVAINGAGTVTFVNGKPTASSKTKKAKGTTLEGGLGDLLLDAGYYVLEEEPEKRPFVLLEGEVKCPTASKSKGLGTGKFDESIMGTVGMTLQEHWKAEARLGYEFIGQPSNVPEEYHNTVDYDVGVAFVFNAKNELWARIQGNAPAVVQGTTAPVLLVFEYDHYGAKSRFYAEIGFGLSTGAPDFLLALGFRINF
jgi:hypothetical protein